jgi:hypothetical protein
VIIRDKFRRGPVFSPRPSSQPQAPAPLAALEPLNTESSLKGNGSSANEFQAAFGDSGRARLPPSHGPDRLQGRVLSRIRTTRRTRTMIPCSAQRCAPRNRRHGATAFRAMDLRVAPDFSKTRVPGANSLRPCVLACGAGNIRRAPETTPRFRIRAKQRLHPSATRPEDFSKSADARASRDDDERHEM